MRIILRRSPTGFRSPRGDAVLRLQEALEREGHSPLGIDGDFGGNTERALVGWQRARGFEPDGTATERVWRELVRTDPPSLFERCLTVTAAFEGHGYTLAVGNFDGAGVTWGIIGFTLKHGNLAVVLKRVDQRHPGLVAQAFGPARAQELLAILDAPKPERLSWADSVSTGPRKAGLLPEWKAGFHRLGEMPQVRAIQHEVAHEKYWAVAERDFRTFGLSDEQDMALCFDTAVQNGGIDHAKAELIRAGLGRAGGSPTGQTRREIFANAIAEGSNPRWTENVRARKMTIALGQGVANGSRYRLVDWGISDASATADQVGEPLSLAAMASGVAAVTIPVSEPGTQP